METQKYYLCFKLLNDVEKCIPDSTFGTIKRYLATLDATVGQGSFLLQEMNSHSRSVSSKITSTRKLLSESMGWQAGNKKNPLIK